MGYRELLKRYIRHLEVTAGDNYIEAEPREPILTKRDRGELLTLAAEITRDAYTADDVNRVENYNYRLRVLMNRYAVSAAKVAELAGVEVQTVRCWRTSPKSERYLKMSDWEFSRFEAALIRWLESSSS